MCRALCDCCSCGLRLSTVAPFDLCHTTSRPSRRRAASLEQFEDQGCENCPWLGLQNDRGRVADFTTSQFSGMISVMDPSTSWATKWLHLSKSVPGCYTLVVNEEPPGNLQVGCLPFGCMHACMGTLPHSCHGVGHHGAWLSMVQSKCNIRQDETAQRFYGFARMVWQGNLVIRRRGASSSPRHLPDVRNTLSDPPSCVMSVDHSPVDCNSEHIPGNCFSPRYVCVQDMMEDHGIRRPTYN